ncbi:MAG: carboxypeptidase regulatory-like domain-containing protein, partial [Bryobacteraceae bacterium]
MPAQEFRGTITGRVVDAQQGVVVGAKISATNADTGARFETVTGGDGQYTLPFLQPGEYRITAEAQGFKRYIREGVRVVTNDRRALDINLELGQIAETVTVTAETSLLETSSASLGQVITARQIENMPMNGRTPLVLAQLAFGVTPASDPRFYRPFDNAGPSGFSMGGAPAQTNELLLDGAPDTTRNMRVAYNPPVDGVEEVKVETFMADAAYGHTAGGTVNVVMKGGTNAFHGSAYNFNQVSALAATPFFTNRASQKKPVTRYNQYGVNAGAPLIIPKLFNGTNKVFWYFAFEGIKDSFPEPITTSVPSDAFRQGNFASLLTINANYTIYDPTTGVVEGSRIRRQPFVGNAIPANRISAIARNYFQFWPAPNQPGQADGRDNFLSNSVRSDDYDSEIGRLDFNLSEKHKFFYNFRHNYRLENRGNRFFNIGTGNFLKRVNWGTMFDDVYTFNPTTLLNTRLNWTRFTEGSTRPSNGFDMTSLGFPQSLAAASTRAVLPRVEPGAINALGDSGGDDTPFDIFQIFATLTKIRGKHSLKFGADLRLQRESSNGFGNSSGLYQFGTNWTRGPLDNSTSAPFAQEFASFLLGLPTGGNWQV